MGIARRFGIAAALAGLLFMSERALARPEGGLPPVPVNAERMEKLKRFYFKLGYGERVRTDVRERILRVVDGDRKAADALIAKVPWGPIDDLLIRELGGWVDDRTLNEMLAFLDSNEGQKAITLLRIDRSLASIQTLFAVEKERSGSGRLRQAYEDLLSRSWGPPKAPEVPSDAKAPKDSVKPPEARSDVTKIEEAALKDLIAIVSCQAQMQFSGKIDLDGDTVGEFSTLLELTGGVGLRRSPDAVSKGKKQEPPILSSEFANVDANGVATRNGYCFRVFLPDSPHDRKPGFVHEVGPASVGGLSGGSRRIDPDGAEVMWCAYAWPEKTGTLGTRVFFVLMDNDHVDDFVLLESSNEMAKWSGSENAPPGESAFQGTNFGSGGAAGQKGRDGDVWKVRKK